MAKYLQVVVAISTGLLCCGMCPKKLSASASIHGHSGIVESIAFSPDGQKLASTSRDKTAKLWYAEELQLRETLRKAPECRVRSWVFTRCQTPCDEQS